MANKKKQTNKSKPVSRDVASSTSKQRKSLKKNGRTTKSDIQPNDAPLRNSNIIGHSLSHPSDATVLSNA